MRRRPRAHDQAQPPLHRRDQASLQGQEARLRRSVAVEHSPERPEGPVFRPTTPPHNQAGPQARHALHQDVPRAEALPEEVPHGGIAILRNSPTDHRRQHQENRVRLPKPILMTTRRTASRSTPLTSTAFLSSWVSEKARLATVLLPRS